MISPGCIDYHATSNKPYTLSPSMGPTLTLSSPISSKAYDTVDRELLWKTMASYGYLEDLGTEHALNLKGNESCTDDFHKDE